ncbi:MAG TPA: hypothetical protein VKX49_02910 [Bryobacteraceae bacterium]|nr:hypothetical protein [Bryobacteraceae bacterium]
MVERKQLGDLAIQYFRKTLADGDRLANFLLSLDLDRGTASAFLPSAVNVQAITDFQNDDTSLDRFRSPGDDWRSEERKFVHSYLTWDVENFAVWESWPEKQEQANPWDEAVLYFWNVDGLHSCWDRPGGTKFPSRTRYAYVASPDERMISIAFDHARPYPMICALTGTPKTSDFKKASFVVPDSLLAELAANTRHILIGAMDERVCLIWTRA